MSNNWRKVLSWKDIKDLTGWLVKITTKKSNSYYAIIDKLDDTIDPYSDLVKVIGKYSSSKYTLLKGNGWPLRRTTHLINIHPIEKVK